MRGSLHAKVFAVGALVTATLVLVLAAYFVHRHVTVVRHAIDRRFETYAALAAHETELNRALDEEERLAEAEVRAAEAEAAAIVLIALAAGIACAWLVSRHFSSHPRELAEPEPEPAAATAHRLLGADGREIELLLAHVATGFVIVDREGKLGAHHSAVMGNWFGEVRQGAPLSSLFRATDARSASHLDLAWEGLSDGFLPTEVALDQFPKELRHGTRLFSLQIHPINDLDGNLESALVALDDITDERSHAERDAAKSDLVALCERALVDRALVADFVAEGDSLKRTIEISETLTDLRHAVHTLKGVAAQAGAASIAEACHAVEQGMENSDEGAPKSDDIATLDLRWTNLTAHLRRLFSSNDSALQVTHADLESLIRDIGKSDDATLAQKASLLLLEPMQTRLERVKEGAKTLAVKLGKDVEITGSAYGLRCDPAAWTPFWSAFNHVVRNALDHGIEIPDVRVATGKSAKGALAIDIMRRKNEVVVEVMEDGAGIDWKGIAKKAEALGLPTAARGDLEAALFSDGVSTRDHAGDVSGRGLGLGAMRAVTDKMGGRISIVSMRGVGTTIRFAFPIATLGHGYREEAPSVKKNSEVRVVAAAAERAAAPPNERNERNERAA